jgi:phosphomannomutase/phosphoglucomutase
MSDVAMKVNKSIFRAYDIRGIVDETLRVETVYAIGQAAATQALLEGETTMVVARDGRLSGPKLVSSLIDGLISTGINVIDLGRVPTPILYYATYTTIAKSGIMLTGSHNPSNHNGVKIVINRKALAGEQIQQLYQRIGAGDFSKGFGQVERYDILADYIAEIKKRITIKRPLKVVLDCGNGIAGIVAPMLYRALGCEVAELYCEVDGLFPNHHPDPSRVENLQDLIQMVKQKQADVGLAFDGDGDRLGVVTAQGDIVSPERQLALYAKSILQDNPGAKIIYDVKSTKHLATVIQALGGEAMMWCTGHSLVKAKMRETGALLGGEMSGHVFFNDRWYGFDDALYTATRLLELMAADPGVLNEALDCFPPTFSTEEIQIAMADEEKFSFIKRLVANVDFGDDATLTTLDGLRVDFPLGWGLVRASNTSAYIACRFEGDSQAALDDITRSFRRLMLSVEPNLDLPF